MRAGPRRGARVAAACLLGACVWLGGAKADQRIFVYVESGQTNEYGDVLLPEQAEAKLKVTAYAESSDGKVRPMMVSVWGLGRWDDGAPQGRADFRVLDRARWETGTPCGGFETRCASGRTDADGYCVGSSVVKPFRRVCLRGAKRGQTGADFSPHGCDWYGNNVRERVYVVVGAPVPSWEDCEGVRQYLPVAEPERVLHLPRRAMRSWMTATDAQGNLLIMGQ